MLKKQPFRLSLDEPFPAVIAACAERSTTWMAPAMSRPSTSNCIGVDGHSVEAWDTGGALVGGLYGLAIGACFCGESMFHRADDAAKACVVHLVDHLQARGFRLLDCQQQSPHMQRFGAYEVSDRAYAGLLKACRATLPGDDPRRFHQVRVLGRPRPSVGAAGKAREQRRPERSAAPASAGAWPRAARHPAQTGHPVPSAPRLEHPSGAIAGAPAGGPVA